MTSDIVLQSGSSRAEISATGAELRLWSCGGRELLWRPDASVWPGVSPLLFPIVGWARNGEIRVDGRSYPMGVHGFAAGEVFEVASTTADEVRFELCDNARTRAQYPFGFRLSMTYRVLQNGIAMEVRITNSDIRPMPYAFGLHPGFCWPLSGQDRAGHLVRFAREETPEVPEIAPGGLFSDRRRSVPMERGVLQLTDELLAREALCFLDARSSSVVFEAPDGSRLTVDAQGFRHWALWSRPPAPFLCIEAWTGHGDPEHFSDDLSRKPSMIPLAPGETGVHKAAFTSVRAKADQRINLTATRSPEIISNRSGIWSAVDA